jgi:hypothetical protein
MNQAHSIPLSAAGPDVSDSSDRNQGLCKVHPIYEGGGDTAAPGAKRQSGKATGYAVTPARCLLEEHKIQRAAARTGNPEAVRIGFLGSRSAGFDGSNWSGSCRLDPLNADVGSGLQRPGF